MLGYPVDPVRSFALVARETVFVKDGTLPLHQEVVGEVRLGTESTATGEFEVSTGTMYITADPGIARLLLSQVEIDERPQRSAWEVPFAGLDARWEVVGERSTSILVQAGPVVVLGRDRFLADGAYSHLMDGIRNVLENTAHVLYHLYAATQSELGLE